MRIELTELELSVLKRIAKGTFNANLASVDEQDAELSLIDKATQYEQKNNLIDERIAYTQDCNLLKWFYYRYQMQK